MQIPLTESQVRVIKQSLRAHLKQCEIFIEIDNKVGTFTVLERCGLEEKIEIIKELIDNI